MMVAARAIVNPRRLTVRDLTQTQKKAGLERARLKALAT